MPAQEAAEPPGRKPEPVKPIHLIDLCFYKDSVTNCVEKNDITQVLAPYNIPFCTGYGHRPNSKVRR